MVTATTTEPRTYGGWRRSRSLGIGRLDSRQTVILMTAVLVPLLAAAFGAVRLAFVLAGVALPVLGLALVQRGGVLLMDLALARARWQWAAWRGETSYRGGVFAELPRAWDLPGVLAPTTLLDVEEPGRGRVGVVWNQRTGWMSVTLLLSPAGALLADRATVERQVAAWGDLLASLADDETVRAAAVTIELVPESGTQLADHVAGRLDPDAPELARRVLGELVAAAPRGAARVNARLTLTVDPAAGGARPRSVPEAAAEALRSLAGLSVTAAGADVLRRASATDLVRMVRCAFDPDAAMAGVSEFDALTWGEAGPVAAEDLWDHYRHDGAYSISWALLEAPRQRVCHDVLLPLLSPGRFPRRVTILYRTLSRDEAGAVLEREVNAAAAREEYRRRTRRDPTARERADAERAARAAAEEAHGAGLVQFSLFVTTTVTRWEDLADARREVEQAAGRSRLKLRIARGGQSAAFAVGLPCGIYPPAA
ncbi:hypothetical protein C3Y87_17325 [Carbonactinospora thermoautotrophica]|nr:hypothetical protein [Carbonactinospora thermoautotrophica]